MTTSAPRTRDSAGIDLDALDRALDEAGIDVLIANSKHNVAWLLGGFRSSFFVHMDAIGLSRYLPLFVYAKGKPDSVAYWGQHMEAYDKEMGQIWVERTAFEPHGSVDAMMGVVAYLLDIGFTRGTMGIERSFLPADAEEVLRDGLPDCDIVDAHFALEGLRMIKTPSEIDLLREASERIEAAMVASFASARPGMTKNEFLRIVQVNEVHRGLDYDYAFVSIDTVRNPNPSSQKFTAGGKATLDSGGNYYGYIGDISRVGCFGTPDQELLELLAAVDTVQQSARAVVKPGRRAGDVVEVGLQAVRESPYKENMFYTAHGMGLVGHERPQIARNNPHGYPAVDEDLALQAGMVLSIEAGLRHPERGGVALEDTIVVTDTGCEALGDDHRGWNAMGVG
jgi:Xaa-Pro aminopeptidase